MRDRTWAILLTVVVVLLLGVPGLGFMCLGLTGFILSIFRTSMNLAPGWTSAFNLVGLSGVCIGLILVAITVIISYLLLHRREDFNTVKPVEPIPPKNIEPPAPPPPAPDEPLPPTT